jgi:repressor LexA
MDSVKFMGWDMVILPYVGKTAAGQPIEISAYTGQGWPFPLPKLKGNAEDYFVVLIDGTSMTEAGINTGDYVVIRKAEEPKNGKIMLVRYENSSTLKRIKIEKRKGKEAVYLYWEDGSGDFKMVDSTEYEIQGVFYQNLGK